MCATFNKKNLPKNNVTSQRHYATEIEMATRIWFFYLLYVFNLKKKEADKFFLMKILTFARAN